MRIYMQAQVGVVLLLTLWSCAGYKSRDCSAPPISKRDIIAIVQREIQRRGGDPSPVETSIVKIKRQGCDYLYHQVYRPKRPGGYFFARVDQFGRVVDWVPGL